MPSYTGTLLMMVLILLGRELVAIECLTIEYGGAYTSIRSTLIVQFLIDQNVVKFYSNIGPIGWANFGEFHIFNNPSHQILDFLGVLRM